MTFTTDHDKMLRSLLEDDFVPDGPLAVPAHLHVVLRKHPEAGELLSAVAAGLVREIDQFDRDGGGSGITYDPHGSSETEAELKLRLYLNLDPPGDLFARLDAIQAMLGELAASARQDVAGQQSTDLRARIADELTRPIPHAVFRRLVPVHG